MDSETARDTICWRIHLRSPPEEVYEALSTAKGRARFWASSAPEKDGVVHFTFPNGDTHRGRVLEKAAPTRFALEYFGGSRVQFELVPDGRNGTDLVMTESEVPPANLPIHVPGWIPVLLGLKAAVDFSVDLRNHDEHRTWEAGYVDV
ncbi:MAG: SRPBCC domain-containing protein [Thermoplasmata archaeon]